MKETNKQRSERYRRSVIEFDRTGSLLARIVAVTTVVAVIFVILM